MFFFSILFRFGKIFFLDLTLIIFRNFFFLILKRARKKKYNEVNIYIILSLNLNVNHFKKVFNHFFMTNRSNMNAIGPWELAGLTNVIIDYKFLELCNYIFIIKLNTWTHL